MGAVVELLVSSKGQLPPCLGSANVWFGVSALPGRSRLLDLASEYVCVKHDNGQSQEQVKNFLLKKARLIFQTEKYCF